jgi:hypothetical protein
MRIVEMGNLFYRQYFAKKINNRKSIIFPSFHLPQVKGKIAKNCHIFIFYFHRVAINIEGRL